MGFLALGTSYHTEDSGAGNFVGGEAWDCWECSIRHRPHINNSRNTNFCVGCFEFHFRKILAKAPKNRGKSFCKFYLLFQSG